MDVKMFVYDQVMASIKGQDFEQGAIRNGIDAYVEDNGFSEAANKFNPAVVQKVIINSLTPVLNRPAERIVLYFSNYRLIEDIRLVNNRSLKFARERERGAAAEQSELQQLETAFQDHMSKVYQVNGLYEMLKPQISEIILNIDYAKGASPYRSQRLKNVEGVN